MKALTLALRRDLPALSTGQEQSSSVEVELGWGVP